MSRSSRNPDSGAVIHEMSAENRARYERMKDRGVGGRGGRDPWGWATSDPADVWPGRKDSYRPNLYPPQKADDR